MKALYRYHGPKQEAIKKPVVITEEIALWLGRMAVGEGGAYCSSEKLCCMFWALLNRYFLHRKRKKWPSFLYLMRRFSQPINPRWYRGGDLALKYAGTKYTTVAKFKRRERIASLGWNDFRWEMEDTIIKLENGLLPPPAKIINLDKHRISDWASHPNLPKKFPWGTTVQENGKRKDWFFENRHLADGRVVIDHWTR